MAFISVLRDGGWVRVVWTGPGLPQERFRIGIRAGSAEYRPEHINSANSGLRARAMSLLTAENSRLGLGLLDLIARSDRLEHSAWIAADGSLVGVQQGDIGGVDASRRPGHGIVGFVHTHPVPDGILAPPSGNDFTSVSFTDNPIQLVAERGGRIWMVFSSGYCSLLGRFAGGTFRPVNDGSVSLVYLIVSSDDYRLEETLADQRRQRERLLQHQAEVDAIAAQRRREAELRRSR